MSQRLTGKSAVVSGAGRGIGRAVALALAEEGCNVVVCDLGADIDGTGADTSPADDVAEACRELGVGAVAHHGDITDFAVAADMVQRCVDLFGRIDILCNIAGNDKSRMIWNMLEEEWDRVIGVHLKGTFNLTRHATGQMRKQRYGRILNVSSDAATGNLPAGQSNYGAAKGAISSFTYAIAREMGRYGVTCNAIKPAATTRLITETAGIEVFKRRLEQGMITQEFYDAIVNLPPPESLAMIVAFLCSDEAGHINGTIFGTSGNHLSIYKPAEVVERIARDWSTQGRWTWEEVEQSMPMLLSGYQNPAPAEDAND